MTSIERTAYPRLKRRPSAQELADVYTPTVEDLTFIRATARGPSSTLTLAVLLKVFQRLGHQKGCPPRKDWNQRIEVEVAPHIRAAFAKQPCRIGDVGRYQEVAQLLAVLGDAGDLRELTHEAQQPNETPGRPGALSGQTRIHVELSVGDVEAHPQAGNLAC